MNRDESEGGLVRLNLRNSDIEVLDPSAKKLEIFIFQIRSLGIESLSDALPRDGAVQKLELKADRIRGFLKVENNFHLLYEYQGEGFRAILKEGFQIESTSKPPGLPRLVFIDSNGGERLLFNLARSLSR